ncbi:MAG: hypothetical protein K9L66_05340 [Spirochaetaceae bacterium]|nr:hypothetical protein [Spirochaetaceae bacterium]MCF7948915.1 hypothetical protein [Spirochaetia bacterium]MCF7951076.1 hypothetical protein [Spirochaetaceae bacterium]
MTKTEKMKLYAGRIGLFLAGGLLVFAVMSFTVVNSANKQNEQLTETLDTSRYEAGRLLADAEAQFENRNYVKAKESLTALFANQPGSEEAAEGKALMLTIENAEKASNESWEAAMPAIKQEWGEALAAEILAKADAERAKLEENMDATINKEWDKAKEKVRENWEMEG